MGSLAPSASPALSRGGRRRCADQEPLLAASLEGKAAPRPPPGLPGRRKPTAAPALEKAEDTQTLHVSRRHPRAPVRLPCKRVSRGLGGVSRETTTNAVWDLRGISCETGIDGWPRATSAWVSRGTRTTEWPHGAWSPVSREVSLEGLRSSPSLVGPGLQSLARPGRRGGRTRERRSAWLPVALSEPRPSRGEAPGVLSAEGWQRPVPLPGMLVAADALGEFRATKGGAGARASARPGSSLFALRPRVLCRRAEWRPGDSF